MTQKPIKWTLVECNRYDGIHCNLCKDGFPMKTFMNYEAAEEEFNKAISFVEKDVVLKEITL